MSLIGMCTDNEFDYVSIATYYFFVAPYPIEFTSIEAEKVDDNNVLIMWKVCNYVHIKIPEFIHSYLFIITCILCSKQKSTVALC